MHSRGSRLARGWVVGAFATAVAALSHAVAGGGTPSWLALAVGVVFAGLLGTIATGPRPSLPRLSIAVAGSQLAFHVGFSYLGTSPTSAASSASIGHAHGAPAVGMVTELGDAGLHHADGPLMWGAHALAAVATILFLRHAERALWSLLTQAAVIVLAPFRTSAGAGTAAPVAVALPRAPLTVGLPRRLVGRLLSSVVSRRGPPLSVAF